jgi:hypothetical protein
MTLVCILCNGRIDPAHNPKLVGYVCFKCLRTKEFEQMNDKQIQKMIREVAE